EAAVRHRLAAPGAAAGSAEHEAQVAPGEHREARCGVHVLVEAELVAVEVDRSINVVDDVSNADRGHASPFVACRSRNVSVPRPGVRLQLMRTCVRTCMPSCTATPRSRSWTEPPSRMNSSQRP